MNARRAFTLFEILVVTAVVALLAGVIATGIARTSDSARARQAAGAIVSALAIQRAHAMDRGRPHDIELIAIDESLIARTEAGESEWKIGAIALDALRPEPLPTRDLRAPSRDRVTIRFSPDGRADVRRIDASAQGSGDTLFTILVDPLSGTPTLMRDRS
ncbi:MAG: prepilin-type N-terminal cleavage/methylation domain-containing protein [Planctomycetota bacterium]